MFKKDDPTSLWNQAKQLIGGTVAAGTYVSGVQPECLREVEPTDETRQKFAKMLKKNWSGRWATYEQQMMKGQNGAQTKLDQTMPESTIQLFEDQLQEHQDLDSSGASDYDHHAINVRHHQKLSDEFGKNKYWSGKYLHLLGKKQAQFGMWNTDPVRLELLQEFMEKYKGFDD